MKKIFAILLALSLSLSVAACTNDNEKDPDDNNPGIETPVNETENPGNENPNEENPDAENPGEENPDEIIPDTTPSDELKAILDFLNEKAEIDTGAFYMQKITSEQSHYTGLSVEEFASNIEEAVVSEPMMSPASHSVTLLKLKDTADVAAIKAIISEKANPMKWICMGSEKVLVAESGNYIILALSNTEKCEALFTAFSEKFEGNVGEKVFKDSSEFTPVF